jgi:hypothetical protein
LGRRFNYVFPNTFGRFADDLDAANNCGLGFVILFQRRSVIKFLNVAIARPAACSMCSR